MVQFAGALILQNVLNVVEVHEEQRPSTYKTWAKSIDVMAKLHHDEELERAYRGQHQGQLVRHQVCLLFSRFVLPLLRDSRVL